MDDTRTMAQLLEAPTAGYEDAIVVPDNHQRTTLSLSHAPDFQIKFDPPGFPPVQNNHNVQNQGNNQNRYNQTGGISNQASLTITPDQQGQIPIDLRFQPPAYQAPPIKLQLLRFQGVSKEDFS
ncbi:hypothetical protein Tco_0471029 [Tanacetum coccineum]